MSPRVAWIILVFALIAVGEAQASTPVVYGPDDLPITGSRVDLSVGGVEQWKWPKVVSAHAELGFDERWDNGKLTDIRVQDREGNILQTSRHLVSRSENVSDGVTTISLRIREKREELPVGSRVLVDFQTRDIESDYTFDGTLKVRFDRCYVRICRPE